MKLTFFGAAKAGTGSCHCVECNGKRILVDCGLQQGRDEQDNTQLPFLAGGIDAVVVTHAHIDHAGYLPLLYARGFRGAIVTTVATGDLCQIMLRDSAHIQEMEAEWKNRKARRAGREEGPPLDTLEDAEGALGLWEVYEYDQRFALTEDVQLRFTDAGHLLGSASIEVWGREGDTEKKIVFPGISATRTSL